MSSRLSLPPRELWLVIVVTLTLTGSILAFAATAPDGGDGGRLSSEVLDFEPRESRLERPRCGLAAEGAPCPESAEPTTGLGLLDLSPTRGAAGLAPGIEEPPTLLTDYP